MNSSSADKRGTNLIHHQVIEGGVTLKGVPSWVQWSFVYVNVFSAIIPSEESVMLTEYLRQNRLPM